MMLNQPVLVLTSSIDWLWAWLFWFLAFRLVEHHPIWLIAWLGWRWTSTERVSILVKFYLFFRNYFEKVYKAKSAKMFTWRITTVNSKCRSTILSIFSFNHISIFSLFNDFFKTRCRNCVETRVTLRRQALAHYDWPDWWCRKGHNFSVCW